ncbi:MAG: nitroreductase family protein [Ignavibacteriae bacterium]|nr:nitroreductase family protein [Ignavibacteriota bacterium]
MELQEAILNRRTTNTKFADKKVSPEHIELLIRMASFAPSHFNSQPWRFIVVEDEDTISRIGKIAGDSMVQLMEEGTFWKKYEKYFRITKEEIENSKDGIHIDHFPKILKPFAKQIMSEKGGKLMAKLKIPKILGKDEEELVASSPILFVILLNKEEYIPGALSGFYSTISMGAVIQNLWLVTTDIGMGMQFVSTPGEIPEKWKEISEMLNVPGDHELAAVFRMGYKEEGIKRPTIDWKSAQRKAPEDLAFKNKWGNSLKD